MIFATIVRLMVKAIGRPSGMNAIPTLTQSTIKVGTLIQSGWSFRSQAALESSFIETGFKQYEVNNIPQDDDYDDDSHNEADYNENKPENFFLHWSHLCATTIREASNSSENSQITGTNTNSQCSA